MLRKSKPFFISFLIGKILYIFLISQIEISVFVCVAKFGRLIAICFSFRRLVTLSSILEKKNPKLDLVLAVLL